jgi:hypothetical protein
VREESRFVTLSLHVDQPGTYKTDAGAILIPADAFSAGDSAIQTKPVKGDRLYSLGHLLLLCDAVGP